MKRIIHTERLCLRPICEDDRDILIALMKNEQIKRTYMLPDFSSSEEENAMFERFKSISNADDRFFYGISFGERLIGWIGEVKKNEKEIELGYVIAPGEHNRGYATEALSASIKALFDAGFEKVCAGAFEENPASMRVMEKCSMKRNGKTDRITYRQKEHLCIFYEISGKRNEEI